MPDGMLYTMIMTNFLCTTQQPRGRLEDKWHERLMFQLNADCSLLEACGVMDYSLLLGVHFTNR